MSIIRIPGQPQQSIMSAKDWKRAWFRAHHQRPGRTSHDQRVVEDHFYGAVEWHKAANEQWTADAWAFWVVEPNRAVSEAQKAARAVTQPRLQRAGGFDMNLLPGSLFAGFSAVLATAFASPLIPYDLAVGTIAALGAAAVPEILNQRKATSATRLTVQQIGGHRAAFALTSIAARAAEDHDVQVMVTDTVRDILWAAPKAGPRVTGARIAQIFDALPARTVTRSWIDAHPGPGSRTGTEVSEEHEIIDARVEATTQWLAEEAAARRATDPAAHPGPGTNVSLPHTTQP